MTRKRIIILGGHGFVGTNLHAYFSGHTDYDFDTPPRQLLDITDLPALTNYLRTAQPDVVVDLAAFVGGIGLNGDHPADMIQRNLQIGINVVAACHAARGRDGLTSPKLVYVGTVCSYPHTPPHLPFIEDDLWQGRPEPTNEPYGVAKKTVGIMLDAYRRQYGLRSAYLLPTNMYGRHDHFVDHASHVIPAMIRKYVEATATGTDTIQHWGSGRATRDFMHVSDFAAAIHAAIERVDTPMPINLGTGIEVTMRRLAGIIAGIVGYRGTAIWDASRPDGQPRRCLDTTRARTCLDFHAKVLLEDGLRDTIDWYTSTRNPR